MPRITVRHHKRKAMFDFILDHFSYSGVIPHGFDKKIQILVSTQNLNFPLLNK
jgi:hypothetical protein